MARREDRARAVLLYAYGLQEREPPYAYSEGYKSSIHTHLNYGGCFTTLNRSHSDCRTSPATRKLAAQAGGGDGSDASRVTVFDVEVTGVSEWGNIYILTNNGQLTPPRREIYFCKTLHATQHLDESYVADIHRQDGDYLYYAKGDWDGSMTCYLKTIGWFLDARRIHNLVTYLQELLVHALGLANADHATLLLNAYTKLKELHTWTASLKQSLGALVRGSRKVAFYLTLTLLSGCAGRQAHASYLAKRYELHEEYLRFMIEDAGKYGEALSYLRHLGADALARYGRAMLDNLPEEMTQLLIDLCTISGPLT